MTSDLRTESEDEVTVPKTRKPGVEDRGGPGPNETGEGRDTDPETGGDRRTVTRDSYRSSDWVGKATGNVFRPGKRLRSGVGERSKCPLPDRR